MKTQMAFSVKLKIPLGHPRGFPYESGGPTIGDSPMIA